MFSRCPKKHLLVIPVETGIHEFSELRKHWILVFAGMTTFPDASCSKKQNQCSRGDAEKIIHMALRGKTSILKSERNSNE